MEAHQKRVMLKAKIRALGYRTYDGAFMAYPFNLLAIGRIIEVVTFLDKDFY